eukprot:g13834.t1
MAQAILVCLGVSVFLSAVLIYSATQLQPSLGHYNTILQSISAEAWGTGRHWLGLGHRFVKFPSTVITVQFSHDAAGASGGPLRSRTYDGLEVSLEISFQYQLSKDSLYQMYTTFGPGYHDLFVKMGMDLLTVAATNHIARAFFEHSLRQHFRENAFVDVPLFQFQAVSLPTDFESAIKETQVAEQKIRNVQAQQKMRQLFYTAVGRRPLDLTAFDCVLEVIQAQRYVQVRSQQATAMAETWHQIICASGSPTTGTYDGLMTHPCLASAKLAEGLDSSATGELQATFRCLEGSETLAAALLGAALARGTRAEGIYLMRGAQVHLVMQKVPAAPGINQVEEFCGDTELECNTAARCISVSESAGALPQSFAW